MSTAPDHSKKEALQQKVLEAIAGKQLAGAAVSMGVGKTLIGLKDMDRIMTGVTKEARPLHPLFLVAAPKKSILDSWKQEAIKFGLGYLLVYIDFTTYASLPKRVAHYHKIYLDEMQSLKDSHRAVLDAHLARKKAILGLTGTEPKYKKSEKGKLVARYCPVVYNYTTDEAIEDGILNDYRIVVHALDLSDKKDYLITFKNGGGKRTSEVETYNYWTSRLLRAEGVLNDDVPEPMNADQIRIMRMQAMMKFPSKQLYMHRLQEQFDEQKVILFVNNIEQAKQMKMPGYFTGNKESNQNLADFSAGLIKRLVCIQQLSEGISIQNLGCGIIWHAFGNERKAAQRIGRMLRLSVDQLATVHVLMYRGTVDETWVERALEKFDSNKVIYIDHQF